MRLMKIGSLLALSMLLIMPLTAQNQSAFLDQRISISVQEKSLAEALDLIAGEGGFLFSYNADLIDGKSVVSVDAENRSVDRVLKQLLGPSIKPMVVGHHVVLLNKNFDKEEGSSESEGYLVTGYLWNKENGMKIAHATIFDIKNNACYSTNEDGSYEIPFSKDGTQPILNYCKAGYLDTMVVVYSNTDQSLNISLEPHAFPTLETKGPSALDLKPMNENRLVNAMVPRELQTTAENLSIYDPGSVQVSLLPFVGTNRLIKGSLVHRLSINILAGYSSGINGVEVGGLLNIIRYDVSGVQVAGIGNMVGGDVTGTQVAGVFNANSGKMDGVQIAGLSNTIRHQLKGVQVAGFSNFSREQVDGIQVSGFSNVSLKDVNMLQVGGFVNYGQNIKGTQVSGCLNIASEKVHATQIAGVLNIANKVNGLQLSGVLNCARDSMASVQISGLLNTAKNQSGFQLAGFANVVSDQSNGMQMSGFMNYAKKVEGLQLSTFNFADTVQKGVPVGFFSYVKKGYHPVEIGTNELFPVSLSFKTGVNSLYNIFSVAYHPEMISGGYGYGSLLALGKRTSISFDLTGNLILTTVDQFEINGVLSRFSPAFNFRPFRKIVLSFGPSLNFYQAIRQQGDLEGISDKPFHEHSTNNGMQQWWLGWNVGIRF